jgi:hypothetical protein
MENWVALKHCARSVMVLKIVRLSENVCLIFGTDELQSVPQMFILRLIENFGFRLRVTDFIIFMRQERCFDFCTA